MRSTAPVSAREPSNVISPERPHMRRHLSAAPRPPRRGAGVAVTDPTLVPRGTSRGRARVSRLAAPPPPYPPTASVSVPTSAGTGRTQSLPVFDSSRQTLLQLATTALPPSAS